MPTPSLVQSITAKRAVIGVVGLGYVGLPLAVAFAKAGCRVIGFDIDPAKVKAIAAGKSYIQYIADADIAAIAERGGKPTSSPALLKKADAIVICVPTPLTRHREPDMRFIKSTAEMLAKVVRKGQLIVLESTTYPGTTREILLPALSQGGLKAGKDFFLAYSPEREDPGSNGHSTRDIPKVVAGLTPACLKAASALYDLIVPRTVPVSSLETAEATKLMENIFRCVNIALVNELKQVFTRMGIDVWEVIEAAKTKPFGYMPFYPGPGLGGHCIPIDPFYLTWKAREFDCFSRFIELAGEVNTVMPEYVVERTAAALNEEKKSLCGSAILVMGLAYKKDVADTRESPSLRIFELLENAGAKVDYHDPLIPVIPRTRRYKFNKKSVPLTPSSLRKYDAILITTDHSDVDYAALGKGAGLIIDTRNIMSTVRGSTARVVTA